MPHVFIKLFFAVFAGCKKLVVFCLWQQIVFYSKNDKKPTGVNCMVYCSKCGTKNDDTAKHCESCGANLKGSTKNWEKQIEEGAEEFGRKAEKWGQQFGKQAEEECFGLPHGGIIFGLAIGVLIVLFGLLSLAGISFWSSIWAIILILVGVLIFGGSVYSLIKRH